MPQGEADGGLFSAFPSLWGLSARHPAATALFGAVALAVGALLLAPAGPRAAAMAEATVRAEPAAIAAGATVVVTGEGFPATTRLEVGAGPPRSEYRVVGWALSDASGRVRHEVHLGQTASLGMVLVFVVSTEDFTIKGVSEPVEIVLPAMASATGSGFGI